MCESVLYAAVLFSSIPAVTASVLSICFMTKFILLLVFFFPFSYSDDGNTVGHFFGTEL